MDDAADDLTPDFLGTLILDNVPEKVRRRVRRQIFLSGFWVFLKILRHSFFPFTFLFINAN